jgi:hypothetical protein
MHYESWNEEYALLRRYVESGMWKAADEMAVRLAQQTDETQWRQVVALVGTRKRCSCCGRPLDDQ